MVQKGLKQGDSFQDGGRTYFVWEVHPDGSYHSSTTPPPVKDKPDKGSKK